MNNNSVPRVNTKKNTPKFFLWKRFLLSFRNFPITYATPPSLSSIYTRIFSQDTRRVLGKQRAGVIWIYSQEQLFSKLTSSDHRRNSNLPNALILSSKISKSIRQRWSIMEMVISDWTLSFNCKQRAMWGSHLTFLELNLLRLWFIWLIGIMHLTSFDYILQEWLSCLQSDLILHSIMLNLCAHRLFYARGSVWGIWFGPSVSRSR